MLFYIRSVFYNLSVAIIILLTYPFTAVLKLAVEKSVYSVVDGDYLEICIIIVRGTVIFSFAIRVDLITPSKI